MSIDPASGATVVHPAIKELQYCMELVDQEFLRTYRTCPASPARREGTQPELITDAGR